MGTGASTTGHSHNAQTSHWIPPQESWKEPSSDANSLPYGWEEAIDKKGKPYFINHVDKTTTPDSPAAPVSDPAETPQIRDVVLIRDPHLGFGFVAGSEKPVVVRFVTENGPSEHKLLPGDQILSINGEDVKDVPRERVIELVRSCTQSISLTISQPALDNSARKSAILTAAKKARLKNNPSRVRFAESVVVNGDHASSPSNNESYIPLMPNVLKVFLENGQTKSFKYDSNTSVNEVLQSLEEKLGIKHIEHFALILHNMKSPTHRNMTFLHEADCLAEIAARPGSQHFKCELRFAFVPNDLHELLQTDPIAFEYLYMQCCNDVVQERFASELKYDVALQLAASHIVQYAIANNISTHKISLKQIEKDCGLDKFVSATIRNSTKLKDLRKMLNHYIKTHPNLSIPGSKHPLENLAKLQYIFLLSDLRSFGGKCFVATLRQRQEAIVVVGPKYGISVITNMKSNMLAHQVDFKELQSLNVTKESERMDQVELWTTTSTTPVVLSMVTEEVQNFVALAEGYFQLETKNKSRRLIHDDMIENNNPSPPYNGEHVVLEASWNYREKHDNDNESSDYHSNRHVVDLSRDPPSIDETTGKLDPEEEEFRVVEDTCVLPATTPEKPRYLAVTTTTIHAPLASPDVSTISGSSDSSIAQEVNDVNSDVIADVKRLSSVSDPGDLPCEIKPEWPTESISNGVLPAALDKDNLKETDKVTNNLGNKIENGEINMATRMDGNGRDKRFGIKAFRTFSAPMSNTSEYDDEKHSPHDLENVLVHPRDDDSQSETDTESTLTCGSGQQQLADQSETVSETGSSCAFLDMLHSGSDTDDMSTPTASPAKARLKSVETEPPHLSRAHTIERPQSFGLHSPDQIPATEDHYKHIASTYGLHSPEVTTKPEQSAQPVADGDDDDDVAGAVGGGDQEFDTNKRFCDGALYLDPDIIDLTLLPPPDNSDPHHEILMDFASSEMMPPPDFDDASTQIEDNEAHIMLPHRNIPDLGEPSEQPLPAGLDDLPDNIRQKIDKLVMNDEELDIPMSDLEEYLRNDDRLPIPVPLLQDADNELESGIGSGEDSGNETISSEIVELGSSISDVTPLPRFDAGLVGVSTRDTALVGVSTGDAALVGVSTGDAAQVGISTGDAAQVGVSPVFDIGGIDAFIAEMTVPPPPGGVHKDDNAGAVRSPGIIHGRESITDCFGDDELGALAALDVSIPDSPAAPAFEEDLSTRESWERLLKAHGLTNDMPHDLLLEEEFAKLVIPPPPITTEADLGSLRVVPPVPISPDDADILDTTIEDPKTSVEITSPPAMNNIPFPQPPVQASEIVAVKIRTPEVKSPATDDISTHRRVLPLRSFEEPKMNSGKSWFPSEQSRSAESSPIHRVAELYAHSRVHNVMGTLPRSINRTKKAPPPPPRRSSIPSEKVLDDLKESPIDKSSSAQQVVRERNQSTAEVIYDNPCIDDLSLPHSSTDKITIGSNSFSSTDESSHDSKDKISTPPEVLNPQVTTSSTNPNNAALHPRNGGVPKGASSSASSHTVESLILQYSQGIDNTASNTPSSPSFDISKPLTSNGSKFNTLKSKIKSYVSPVHKKSTNTSPPNAPPKLPTKDKDKSLVSADLDLRKSEFLNSNSSPSSSPKTTTGRGSSFSDSSQSRSFSSPKTSPMIARHTSLVEGGDSSPRTFRTFLGGVERLPSVGSASDPDIGGGTRASTAKKPKKPATAEKSGIRADITQLTSASQSSELKSSSVPIKIRRPRLSSSSSTNSEQSVLTESPHTASPTSHPAPLRVSQQPDSPMATFHLRSRSQDDEETKVPPWRSRSPGWSTFKSDKGSTTPPLTRKVQPPKPERKTEPRKKPTNAAAVKVSEMSLQNNAEAKSANSFQSVNSTETSSFSRFTVIENKTYEGENCFTDANSDVIELITLLSKTVEKLGVKTSGSATSSDDFKTRKDELVSHSRQFVTDSKLLVSSATHSKEKLIQNVDSSMQTLLKIVRSCEVTIATMNSQVNARALGSKVKDVANAYKTTVDAARNAAGMPLSDPNMKMLMRQATSLAAILSIYMKSLKAMDNL